MAVFLFRQLIQELAQNIRTILPNATVYADSVRQGVKYPAVFIGWTQSKLEHKLTDHAEYQIGIKLSYFEKQNLSDNRQRLLTAAQKLDEGLQQLTYGGLLLWTQNRNWEIKDGVLYFYFVLQLRLHTQKQSQPISKIQQIFEVKYGQAKNKTTT